MSKIDVGKQGELFAATYLEEHGYHILERNFKYGRYEIDLIARMEDTLVIVEVKSRNSDLYGKPEAQLTEQQEFRIAAAAAEYMEKINWEGEFRFDVIGVLMDDPTYPVIRHYPDAFRC